MGRLPSSPRPAPLRTRFPGISVQSFCSVNRNDPSNTFGTQALEQCAGQEKARPGKPERADEIVDLKRRLALYFGGFFLLGLFFLFLEFEFVADELEDGHFGVVADAIAGVDDARVTASTIREFRRDLAEQLLRDGREHDVGSGHAARLQRVALAEGDHFLRHWARCFRARQRRSDSPVFKQIGDQAAQHRAAMGRLLTEFGTRIEMSHRLYCPSSPYSPTVSSEAGAAVWLGSGGQMMRPCSSNFMPSARPIFTSISLISLSDLRPKFLVFSILFSLFWTI